jgi:hypothetical protein
VTVNGEVRPVSGVAAAIGGVVDDEVRLARSPVSVQLAVYPVIGEPPLLAGGVRVKAMVADVLPGVPTMSVGASGTVITVVVDSEELEVRPVAVTVAVLYERKAYNSPGA